MGNSYVDWVNIAIVIAVRVAIGKEAVREEREKDELRQGEELIS
jgi:hypothetical protein